MFRKPVVGPSPQAAAQAQAMARQAQQEQAAAQQAMAMAATELEYRVELLNRMVAGCFEKCSARPLSLCVLFLFFGAVSWPPPPSASARSPLLFSPPLVSSWLPLTTTQTTNRFKDGAMSVGETVCADRCAAKYWQVVAIVGTLLGAKK